LVGVDEHQTATIEHHGPPPRRVGEMVVPDVDRLRRHLAEILNDNASAFTVGAGKDADATIHRQLRAAITVPNIHDLASHPFPLATI
jgi:hypothetical protein